MKFKSIVYELTSECSKVLYMQNKIVPYKPKQKQAQAILGQAESVGFFT